MLESAQDSDLELEPVQEWDSDLELGLEPVQAWDLELGLELGLELD